MAALVESFLISLIIFALNPTLPTSYWKEAPAGWKWDGVVRWNYVGGPELYAMCDPHTVTLWPLMGCARMYQGGVCEIFSSYPEIVAKVALTNTWDTLYEHEIRHCMGQREVSIFDPMEE